MFTNEFVHKKIISKKDFTPKEQKRLKKHFTKKVIKVAKKDLTQNALKKIKKANFLKRKKYVAKIKSYQNNSSTQKIFF